MGRRLAFLLACAVACPCLASAQTPPADGIEALLARLNTVLQSGASGEFASLVSSTFPSEEIDRFAGDLIRPDIRRAVVVERDRVPLASALPGDGYRVVVELFTETADRARIVTALFDVRRPAGGATDTWRITAAQSVTSIEGLFRLRVSPAGQFAARNLTITAEDLVVTLLSGSVFLVESDAGITGLVLFGQGVMRFTPQPQTERGQLRIFGGAETLPFPDAKFDAVLNTMVLHHLPRETRERCAREIRRVLKPGGRVLAVDFGGTPGERKGLIEHFHRHAGVGLHDIINLLTDAGLRIIESGAVGVRGLNFVLATA